MNTIDTIINNSDRKGIDLCTCPQCKGCAGTARVCYNSRKLASRMKGNTVTKTMGLLLACFILQSHAKACRQSDMPSVGYLMVFSSTEENSPAGVSDGDSYYPHTGYRIYDSAGKTVRWITNHDSDVDEAPERVGLAPGKYTIWAQSDKDGYVKVPVVIKEALTTAVHLED